jgi:hypothetical protein
MKKYEKKQTHNPLIITIVILIFSTAGFYLLWNLYSPNEDEKAIGQEPTKEEQEILEEYDQNCPMDSLIFEAEKENIFNVTNVKCSYNELYKDIQTGEDVTVEIYTEDLEEGKREFLNWLTENELSVSDKLRVEYIHKP